jgi:hypothetical protein
VLQLLYNVLFGNSQLHAKVQLEELLQNAKAGTVVVLVVLVVLVVDEVVDVDVVLVVDVVVVVVVGFANKSIDISNRQHSSSGNSA